MAATNYDYNELTHSNSPDDLNGLDPMYRWDTHYPERLTRLPLNPEFSSPGPSNRRKKCARNRNAARYKTQPITFDEIKEVDEECPESDKMEGLKHQFTVFSRSMDGLLPSFKGPMKKLDKIPASVLSPLVVGASTTTSVGPSPALRSTSTTVAHTETEAAVTGQAANGSIHGTRSTPTLHHRSLSSSPPPSLPPPPSSSSYSSSTSSTANKTTTAMPPSADTNEHAQITVSGITLPEGLPMNENLRRRRKPKKKRHNRSIEEAPELDSLITEDHPCTG